MTFTIISTCWRCATEREREREREEEGKRGREKKLIKLTRHLKVILDLFRVSRKYVRNLQVGPRDDEIVTETTTEGRSRKKSWTTWACNEPLTRRTRNTSTSGLRNGLLWIHFEDDWRRSKRRRSSKRRRRRRRRMTMTIPLHDGYLHYIRSSVLLIPDPDLALCKWLLLCAIALFCHLTARWMHMQIS